MRRDAQKHPRQRKPRGTTASSRKAGAQCGAKKRKGGKCTLAAGWGTLHPGMGACKLHGGSAPNHVKAAAKAEYRTLLGQPKEIDPFQAIMWCIKIRAGEVEWLSGQMAALDEKAWVEDTMVGKQFHLFARERQHAMADLARFSEMAIRMGIAERYVRLAEVYGQTIADLITGILGELDLSPEQKAKAPAAIRRQLLLIEGGNEGTTVVEGKAKEITRKAAA